VPFIFVLSERGVGLLFHGGAMTIVIAFVTSVVAVSCLAVVTGAWLIGPAGIPERLLFAVAAVALLVMDPLWIGVGAAFAAAGLVVHLVTRRKAGGGTPSSTEESSGSAPADDVSTGSPSSAGGSSNGSTSADSTSAGSTSTAAGGTAPGDRDR
jgi:hypothetical protein